MALTEENRGRSNPLIADILFDGAGIRIHSNTARNILLERCQYSCSYCRRPSRRFEMEAFAQLVQMDTFCGTWLQSFRRVYLLLIMDDFSRAILPATFFHSNSTYNNMLGLGQAVEHYGIFPLLYADNDSKFKLIRYQGSCFLLVAKKP